MNTKFSRFLTLALLGPSLLLAKERKTEAEQPKIITLAEFAKALETGIPVEQIRNFILECPQGAELPIKLIVQGDTLSLEPNAFTIKLLKPCYIKTGPKVLFSYDLKVWQKFEEFFVGKIATALEFNNQTTQINVELELNQSKNRWEVPFPYAPYGRCKEIHHYTWSPSPATLGQSDSLQNNRED